MLRLGDVINATLLIRKKSENHEFSRFSLVLGKNELVLIDKEGKAFKKIEECKNPFLMKCSEKEDSAEFFLFNENSDIAEKISFYYPMNGKGGIRVDKAVERIGFHLSDSFDADCKGNMLFIADSKNAQYVLMKWNEDACVGKINASGKIIGRIIDEDACIAISENGFNVIKGPKSCFIENKKIAEDFNPKHIERGGIYEVNGKKYAALVNKKKLVLVSLEGEDMFNFNVYDINPFGEKFMD